MAVSQQTLSPPQLEECRGGTCQARKHAHYARAEIEALFSAASDSISHLTAGRPGSARQQAAALFIAALYPADAAWRPPLDWTPLVVMNPDLSLVGAEDADAIRDACRELEVLCPSAAAHFHLAISAVIMTNRRENSSDLILGALDIEEATAGSCRSSSAFVGSSSAHLGVIWLERDLNASDLLCGLTHELTHHALSTLDMACGVFQAGAHTDTAATAPSSAMGGQQRPFGRALHALAVARVLEALQLRMSSDPEKPAIPLQSIHHKLEEHAFNWLKHPAGPIVLELCGSGNSVSQAARDLNQLVHTEFSKRNVAAYAAEHTGQPSLLFWGGPSWDDYQTDQHNLPEGMLCSAECLPKCAQPDRETFGSGQPRDCFKTNKEKADIS